MFLVYIIIGKWEPFISLGYTVYFLFLCRVRSIFAESILWSENTSSKEVYVLRFKSVHKYIV